MLPPRPIGPMQRIGITCSPSSSSKDHMEPNGESVKKPDLMRSIQKNASQLSPLLAVSDGPRSIAFAPRPHSSLDEPMDLV